MSDIRELVEHVCSDQPGFTRPGSDQETLTRAMKKLAQPRNYRAPRKLRGQDKLAVRAELVRAVRERIAAGEYESDEVLRQAVDRMLDELAAEKQAERQNECE